MTLRLPSGLVKVFDDLTSLLAYVERWAELMAEVAHERKATAH